jgi:hypothetical protein
MKPTFGHPGRPGQRVQTSGRLSAYVAIPTTTPSTFTCTLLIAVPIVVVLSIAHPATMTTPLTAPGAGESMYTDGGTLTTVIFTLSVPLSGVPSVSVAETVIV